MFTHPATKNAKNLYFSSTTEIQYAFKGQPCRRKDQRIRDSNSQPSSREAWTWPISSGSKVGTTSVLQFHSSLPIGYYANLT